MPKRHRTLNVSQKTRTRRTWPRRDPLSPRTAASDDDIPMPRQGEGSLLCDASEEDRHRGHDKFPSGDGLDTAALTEDELCELAATLEDGVIDEMATTLEDDQLTSMDDELEPSLAEEYSLALEALTQVQ